MKRETTVRHRGSAPGEGESAGATRPPERSRRNDVVDALKCLAIAMVALTHVLHLQDPFVAVAPWLVRVMVAFNLPLFAFLSGYVLFGREGRKPVLFVAGKALSLLVPYVAWIAVEMPLRGVPPSGWLPRLAVALVNPRAGMQMWFLWVLFWLFVIFTLARGISRSDAWTAGVAIAIAALSAVPLPPIFGAYEIRWLYPFLVLGYLAAKHRERVRSYDTAIAVTGIIGFPAIMVLGASGAVHAAGTFGIAAAWGLYRLLPAPGLRWQAWVGRRTLGVYGWQMVLMPFLVVGSGSLGAGVTWALVMVCGTLLTLAMERLTPTRAVFLGQWPKTRREEGQGPSGPRQATEESALETEAL